LHHSKLSAAARAFGETGGGGAVQRRALDAK